MRFFASLAFAVGALLSVPALAQFQPVELMCGDPLAPCSAANPLPTTASGGNIGVAQGSTTAGELGPLVQCAATTSAPSYTTAQTDPLSCDLLGNLRVSGGIAQGLTTSGQLGSLVMGAVTTTAPTYTNGNTNPLSLDVAGSTRVTPQASAGGGASTYFVQPTASDNHAVVKAGAGTVYDVQVFNNSATINYLRFYDATTGFNGCNSATGLVTQIQIPASTSVGGAALSYPVGKTFATGISVCITSGYATNDTTNATATAMSISVGYK